MKSYELCNVVYFRKTTIFAYYKTQQKFLCLAICRKINLKIGMYFLCIQLEDYVTNIYTQLLLLLKLYSIALLKQSFKWIL